MRYGYFDDENREYVVERPDVPVSWTNYLGVKDMCTVLSHNAGGYSFYKSAEHQRMTRFRPNALPMDRPGHYIYLRDDADGDYWSISWQPVGKPLDDAKDEAQYEVRHGLSYSKFKCNYRGIEATKTLFIPVDDDVELWDITIKNTGDTWQREISLFSYVEFSFQHVEIDNQNFQMSMYASGTNYAEGIIEFDFFYEPWTYHYFASSFTPDSYDCVRDSFIGNYRTETNPIAVENGQCGNTTALTGNHCGSLHKKLTLAPGEEVRLVMMLGVGSREEAGQAMQAKYSDLTAVDTAFANLKAYWASKTAAYQCQTPNEGLNSMINTWTLYQAETCVVWSRFASFVEVGGRTGLGYRDTSQDVMSVAHTNPAKCKQRIVELLMAQTTQGYGLHLFDPSMFEPEDRKLPDVELPTVVHKPKPEDVIHGLEDTCADDALWIVVTTIEYIKETGDFGFLDEVIPFIDGGEGTVYEHLQRALNFSDEHVGQTGICKGLRADWNDCLNLGGGESSMVSFMHYWAIQAFIEAAEYLGQQHDVEFYRQMAARVRKACEHELWDGDWYLRGFTGEGQKIGTRTSLEGKLFLNAQSWAVYSGVASQERGELAMDKVHEHLASPYGLHLFWPAYSEPDDTIGYVTRVYKGVKENAAIFSHPNPWAIIAECVLGRGDKAMALYDAFSPYNQNDIIDVRQAEPYSYCQFIYGEDHDWHGRARHPWLTGTAGWAYTAATKYILGIRLGFDNMVIDPCIPSDWPGFTISRQWRGATYNITIENPNGVQKGVQSMTVNGAAVTGNVPVQPAGSVNDVVVVMG